MWNHFLDQIRNEQDKYQREYERQYQSMETDYQRFVEFIQNIPPLPENLVSLADTLINKAKDTYQGAIESISNIYSIVPENFISSASSLFRKAENIYQGTSEQVPYISSLEPEFLISSACSLIRKAEDTYQGAIKFVHVSSIFPENLASFFITAACVNPSILGLMSFSHALHKVSGHKISSIYGKIIHHYKNTLVYNGLDEIPMDQSLLIQSLNPLHTLPGLFLDIVAPDISNLSNFLSRITNGQIPSLSVYLDKKTDNFLRARNPHALAKFEYDGVCFGLTLCWYKSLKSRKEDLFFTDIINLTTAAQSFTNIELTSCQKSLTQSISEIQNAQSQWENSEKYYAVSLDESLQSLIRICFDCCQKNKGYLCGFSVFKGNGAHIFGLVCQDINDQTFFYIFDSNKGRIRCTAEQKELGIMGFFNLLKYNYKEYFEGANTTNIGLNSYSVIKELNLKTKPKSNNEGLLKNSIFYNKVEEKYLIENRHESSKLQEGYDRRFGLVPLS